MELLAVAILASLMLPLAGAYSVKQLALLRWAQRTSPDRCPMCGHDGKSVDSHGKCTECGRSRERALVLLDHVPGWHVAVLAATAIVPLLLSLPLFPTWSVANWLLCAAAATIPPVMLAVTAKRSQIGRFPSLAWLFILIPGLIAGASWTWMVLGLLGLGPPAPGQYSAAHGTELELRRVIPPALQLLGALSAIGALQLVGASVLIRRVRTRPLERAT